MANEKKREGFGSRLGFILVSAGCAIGIGNVWKFPYLCGKYGGAAFILIYLLFLLILGIPVMVCEFAIGRASQRSAALAFEKLEPAGTNWHRLKFISIIGCYMLMMYYTTVAGWMLSYCFRSIRGDFAGATAGTIKNEFSGMLSNAPSMTFWTILVCLIGFAVCYFGIQNGIERVSKFMMTALLVLMFILAVHSVFLKGAGAGIRFYLVPSASTIRSAGIGTVIFAAMSQAFFTLSIGIGAMLIFGSYLGKDRSLTGEAVTVTSLGAMPAAVIAMATNSPRVRVSSPAGSSAARAGTAAKDTASTNASSRDTSLLCFILFFLRFVLIAASESCSFLCYDSAVSFDAEGFLITSLRRLP